MKPIIQVENLSKLYRIGAKEQGYKTFRESIVNYITAPLRNLRKLRRLTNFDSEEVKETSTFSQTSNNGTIWALKDVSFDVQPGEVIGIIGRNGAGKSTFLKILSRITEPTTGDIKIYGRVSSLLEVGTGFHPELTGRENIYLNGTILGMRKVEIDRKFNEIVEFSGIEKFLDTPVKFYSSGMYVRLAFAVAANLDPEILLIDEVLAVGDAEFQKKCLGKMGDVAKEGRTVLFVSHNMSAISLLCGRAILLREGRIAAQGSTPQIVSEYLSSGQNESGEALWSFEDAPGSELVKLHAVRVLDEQGQVSFNIDIAKPTNLEIEFWCLRRTTMTPSFHLYNHLGFLLFFTTNLHDKVWAEMEYEPGLYRCSCQILGNFLNEGTYFVNANLSSNFKMKLDVRKESAVSFRVNDFGTTQDGYIAKEWLGLIRPLLPWTGSRIGDLP